MDEPHLYRAGWHLIQQENPYEYLKQNPYRLGKNGRLGIQAI
jgi:hypothetical protein